MKTGRYLEGQKNRQAILDYLNENPGAFGPQIQAALNIDPATGAGRLQKMTNSGELRRESELFTGIDRDGNPYRNRSFRYWAVVKVTRSQQEIRKSLAKNVNPHVETMEKVDPQAGKWRGGSYRNTRADRPVIPCPDAMKGVGFRGMTQLEAMA